MRTFVFILCLTLSLSALPVLAQSVQNLSVVVVSNNTALTPNQWGVYDITPGNSVTLNASLTDSNGGAITSTATDYAWTIASSVSSWSQPTTGSSSTLSLPGNSLPVGDYHVTVVNTGNSQYSSSNTLSLALHVGGWQAVSMQVSSPGINNITTATPVSFQAQAYDEEKGVGSTLQGASYSWALYNAPNSTVSGPSSIVIASTLSSPPPVSIPTSGTYYIQAQSSVGGYTPGVGGVMFNVNQATTQTGRSVTIQVTAKPSDAYKSWFTPSTTTQQILLP